MRVDEPRVDAPRCERLVRDDAFQKRDVRSNSGHFAGRERAQQLVARAVAINAPRDHLREQRVVERRDVVAFAKAGIDAHARVLLRHPPVRDPSDRRQEAAGGIFRVDARLDRVAVDCQHRLRFRQRFADRDPQLPFDQIEPGDHFGDRMFDLQTRIHLHEVERAVLLGDELDGAGADIADGLRGRDRGVAHRTPSRRLHARCRRFLDHFLVAPLHRAVALEQVHDIAARVREDLDFDVARRRQITFEQHAIVAEGCFRFAPGRRERGAEIASARRDFHALAAAAGRRLDQNRKADARGFAREQRSIPIVAVITRNDRHAGSAHDRLRG